MNHTKRDCNALDIIIAGECGLQCSNCLACKCGECDTIREVKSILSDKGCPEPNKQYALTGKPGSKCIMNGNTWSESEIKN